MANLSMLARLSEVISKTLDSASAGKVIQVLHGSRECMFGRFFWRHIPRSLSASFLSRIEGEVTLPLHYADAKLVSSRHDDHYLQLVWNGLRNWESQTQKVWVKLARKSDVVVDVGAYLGAYSVLACAARPSARVLAFEPNPNTFRALGRSAACNSFIGLETHNLALGSSSKIVTLSVDAGRPMSSGATLSLLEGIAADLIEVNQVALDSQVKKADLVKVDAEGHELEVLKGAERILRESSPVLILEILEESLFSQLSSFLEPFGYHTILSLRDDSESVKRVAKFDGPGNYLLTNSEDKIAGLES